MSSAIPPNPPPEAVPQAEKEKIDPTPVTQEKRGFRSGWPAWAKQLPRLSFPAPPENFQLIDAAKLEAFFKEQGIGTQTAQRIRDDINHMDHELLRLFRERDYEAAYHQNRYRMFQLLYIMLATLATLIGAFLALMLNANPNMVPILGFAETLVALSTTYLATVSGREPPLPLWMENRRKAEFLRREYFRYLMDLEPYTELEGFEREQRLSLRAARINRGYFPETTQE